MGKKMRDGNLGVKYNVGADLNGKMRTQFKVPNAGSNPARRPNLNNRVFNDA